jgi:multidrug resistance efflux pump
MAQGAYNNNFIYASAPGIISFVNINPGEIVTVNQKVVSLIVKNK